MKPELAISDYDPRIAIELILEARVVCERHCLAAGAMLPQALDRRRTAFIRSVRRSIETSHVRPATFGIVL